MESNYCRSLDVMSKGGKLFLALPVLDIVWGFYRIKKSNAHNRWGQSMFAGLLLIIGIPFMWLVDWICIIKNNRIAWFKDPYEDGIMLDYFKNQGYQPVTAGGPSGKNKKSSEDDDVETII